MRRYDDCHPIRDYGGARAPPPMIPANAQNRAGRNSRGASSPLRMGSEWRGLRNSRLCANAHWGEGGDIQFGDIGVVLCGAFPQLRPIGRKTLIDPISAEISLAASKLRNADQRISAPFRGRAQCSVMYTKGAPCPFKESPRRLRDCAMTLEDYDLWQSRDIASDKCPAELKARAGNFIWLCEENAATVARNGDKLAAIDKSRRPAIFRYPAASNEPSATRYNPREFRGVRANCHIAIGAPVILIANNLFGVYTGRIGLMNGARCAVVAIPHGGPPAPSCATRVRSCRHTGVQGMPDIPRRREGDMGPRSARHCNG